MFELNTDLNEKTDFSIIPEDDRSLLLDIFVLRLKEAQKGDHFLVPAKLWISAMASAASLAQRFLSKRFVVRSERNPDTGELFAYRVKRVL